MFVSKIRVEVSDLLFFTFSMSLYLKFFIHFKTLLCFFQTLSYDDHFQSRKFMATDLLWWRGLARIMEMKGLIIEGDDKVDFHSFQQVASMVSIPLVLLSFLSTRYFNQSAFEDYI